MKVRRKNPEIVLRDGKPSAVILGIDEYRKMLERLEDTEDLRVLSAMRKKPLKFRKLEDFLRGGKFKLRIKSKTIDKLILSYAQGRRGEPLALIDSFNYLEIALNGDSASKCLGMHKGDEIEVRSW